MVAKVSDVETYPYSCCPHCGKTDFHTKMRLSGSSEFHFHGDGTKADNSDMYDGIVDKQTSKYCWCSNCGMRLFEVEA
ncbi:hypothetical protein MH1LPH_10750 [Lactiplantibacillus brownii]